MRAGTACDVDAHVAWSWETCSDVHVTFTLVSTQRVGDVAAAGAFQAAVPAAGFGPSALALMCIPVSIVWTAVAWNLGGHQMSQTKRSIDVGKDGTLRSLGV